MHLAPGPGATLAEVTQLVAMLGNSGLIEVDAGGQGRESYRLTQEGRRGMSPGPAVSLLPLQEAALMATTGP